VTSPETRKAHRHPKTEMWASEPLSPVPHAIPELAARRDPNAAHVLHYDFETRSARDLETAGAWRYAADSTTEIRCCAYAADAEPVQLWTPGDPNPTEFIEAEANPNWLIASHNNQFELPIETCVLRPCFGWPLIPLERRRCTMAAALASALPGSLDGAIAALGLPYRKDAEGYRLMLQMAKPRKDGGWLDGPELRERLYRYCIVDVEVERALFHALPPLPPDEQLLWRLDAQINARGFHVDIELARAAQAIAGQTKTAINAEIALLTNGAITSAGQVTRIATFVRERGHQLKGLTKRSVAAVLAREPEDDVRRLLELRRDGGLASAHKIGALFAGVDADGRMRGTLRFHAAATGRFGGVRYQPQNLRRPVTEHLDAAVDAVLSGNIERVRDLGAPLSIIGDISRSMICAAPRHVLIVGDFSTIEARVLAWFAGEGWKLDAFRRFDVSGDPALDPYLVAATRILKRPVAPDDEAGRHFGKTNELAFGFGGALGAWRRFDPDGYTPMPRSSGTKMSGATRIRRRRGSGVGSKMRPSVRYAPENAALSTASDSNLRTRRCASYCRAVAPSPIPKHDW
jgi:DNA polymerase